MGKKFITFISFVLILSLIFALGAVAVEDSPLAGGMIVDDGPSTNDIIVVDDTPPPADETIADDEFTDDSSLEDAVFEEDELEEDSGELLVDIEIEADTSEQVYVRINPKTGDNMVVFVILSLSVLGAGVYFAKRSKKVRI